MIILLVELELQKKKSRVQSCNKLETNIYIAFNYQCILRAHVDVKNIFEFKFNVRKSSTLLN